MRLALTEKILRENKLDYKWPQPYCGLIGVLHVYTHVYAMLWQSAMTPTLAHSKGFKEHCNLFVIHNNKSMLISPSCT